MSLLVEGRPEELAKIAADAKATNISVMKTSDWYEGKTYTFVACVDDSSEKSVFDKDLTACEEVIRKLFKGRNIVDPDKVDLY